MNKEKEEYIQKQNKFNHIMFSLDTLTKIYELTGTLNSDDFILALTSLYDNSYNEGRQDTIDKYMHEMFQDLGEIERFNKGENT